MNAEICFKKSLIRAAYYYKRISYKYTKLFHSRAKPQHDYRELLIYLLFIQSDEYSKQEDFLAGNGWFFKFKVGHGEHFFTAKVTKG